MLGPIVSLVLLIALVVISIQWLFLRRKSGRSLKTLLPLIIMIGLVFTLLLVELPFGTHPTFIGDCMNPPCVAELPTHGVPFSVIFTDARNTEPWIFNPINFTLNWIILVGVITLMVIWKQKRAKK
jgi:hypothetical protein